MDFVNLKADENHWMQKHYTKGRSGRKLQYTVIHYAYGDLSLQAYYNVWQSRQASAQYAVDRNGRIGQYVRDADTAWTNGNFDANCKSITIEHSNQGDNFTDATIENGARLVAAIHRAYNLGRPEWGINVFGHSDFASTSCPGQLKRGTDYNRRYMERAQAWYDSGPAASNPTPSSPSDNSNLVVDGIWGRATTHKLQDVLNAPFIDGVISRQNSNYRKYAPGCTTGWEWTRDGIKPGSQTIRLIQERLNVFQDGILGAVTTNALISHYKDASGATVRDGRIDNPSRTVRAMQSALNRGDF